MFMYWVGFVLYDFTLRLAWLNVATLNHNCLSIITHLHFFLHSFAVVYILRYVAVAAIAVIAVRLLLVLSCLIAHLHQYNTILYYTCAMFYWSIAMNAIVRALKARCLYTHTYILYCNVYCLVCCMHFFAKFFSCCCRS